MVQSLQPGPQSLIVPWKLQADIKLEVLQHLMNVAELQQGVRHLADMLLAEAE